MEKQPFDRNELKALLDIIPGLIVRPADETLQKEFLVRVRQFSIKHDPLITINSFKAA